MFIDPSWGHTYRMVGIDPGSRETGFSVIDYDITNKTKHVVYADTLFSEKRFPMFTSYRKEYGEIQTRLMIINNHIGSIISEYKPNGFTYELAHYRGIVNAYRSLIECITSMRGYIVSNNIPFYEISASVVKSTIGVSGQSNDKSEMALAIQKIAGIQFATSINLPSLDQHSVDAIAIANAGISLLFK